MNGIHLSSFFSIRKALFPHIDSHIDLSQKDNEKSLIISSNKFLKKELLKPLVIMVIKGFRVSKRRRII